MGSFCTGEKWIYEVGRVVQMVTVSWSRQGGRCWGTWDRRFKRMRGGCNIYADDEYDGFGCLLSYFILFYFCKLISETCIKASISSNNSEDGDAVVLCNGRVSTRHLPCIKQPECMQNRCDLRIFLSSPIIASCKEHQDVRGSSPHARCAVDAVAR